MATKPDLRFDPKNARRRTDRNRALIRKSLKEVGAGRGILVDGDGIVRAGNGVLEAALEAGMKLRQVETAPDELLVTVRKDLTGSRAVRAALFDNAAGDASEWDPRVVMDLADAEFFAGILGDEQLAEIEALSELEEAGEAGLDAAANSILINHRIKKAVRPVLLPDEVAVFEDAMRATGLKNRAEALMAICREYTAGLDLGDHAPKG